MKNKQTCNEEDSKAGESVRKQPVKH